MTFGQKTDFSMKLKKSVKKVCFFVQKVCFFAFFAIFWSKMRKIRIFISSKLVDNRRSKKGQNREKTDLDTKNTLFFHFFVVFWGSGVRFNAAWLMLRGKLFWGSKKSSKSQKSRKKWQKMAKNGQKMAKK